VEENPFYQKKMNREKGNVCVFCWKLSLSNSCWLLHKVRATALALSRMDKTI
jgi:hypothetical protein